MEELLSDKDSLTILFLWSLCYNATEKKLRGYSKYIQSHS